MAMMRPGVANAATVTESEVSITTPDGSADCYFVHPSSGTAPGVLIWPDIFGLRPAFRQMGRRLAESGYDGTPIVIMAPGDVVTLKAQPIVGAQLLREAGFKVKRTVLPSATFWNDWTKFPYSMTDWNMRPLGVQVLALAYRSGEAWNETGYANKEFDAKLEMALAIPDPKDRMVLMKDLESMLQESGIIIQPYWLSLYNHATPQVKNYGMHPTYEVNVEDVWLDV